MWSIMRAPLRKLCVPLTRSSGYAGGVPGNNLPWRKGMNSPIRFTFFWFIIGAVGFGAPWLVVRQILLKNVTDEAKEEAAEGNDKN